MTNSYKNQFNKFMKKWRIDKALLINGGAKWSVIREIYIDDKTEFKANYTYARHNATNALNEDISCDMNVSDAVEKLLLEDKLTNIIDSKLTEVEARRLRLYFANGLTFRQIGSKEGVHDKSVRNSINSALSKIGKHY